MAACERVHSTVVTASPAGSCVWHVIGMQTSIREWALRQGWGGRPVRQESAQGILVAALGVLVKHYGIRDRGSGDAHEPLVTISANAPRRVGGPEDIAARPLLNKQLPCPAREQW